MSEIPVPLARYVLIPDQGSKKCFFQNRYVLFSFALAVLTFIVGTVYVTSVGLHEKLLFPADTNAKEVPKHWISRAVSYNNIDNYVFNLNDTITAQNQYGTYNSNSYKLVCYYVLPNKTKDENTLLAEDVDPSLCTHINVAFASVVNNSLYLEDYQLVSMKSVVALKKTNRNLKVLVSVGGAGNDDGYPQMVALHENRKTFIKSVLDLVKQHGVDGVDLDWEFPNEHAGTDKKQKVHFVQLLEEFRKEIARQERRKFLLSVAVAAPVFMIDNSYYADYMNQYVDYINVMSYDYHYYTKWTPFTGMNAPLYSPPSDLGYFATQNINYSANYWNQKGMEKKKIIVGLPTYGHSFKLMNPKNNALNAPSSGYGKLGNIGFIDYNDVCWFLTNNRISPVFDMESRSPYATKYTEWISFEDAQSLTYKAEFIKNNNFGGAMVLSLNTDDHRGLCKNSISANAVVRFPLTRKIKEVLSDHDL